MARKKAEVVPLDDAMVLAAERSVRETGFAATKKLSPVKLDRRDELVLLERLAQRGLERTPKGVRAPLGEQLLAALATSTAVRFSELGKRVKGATAAEVKRAALALVEGGEAVLVSAERGDAIARAGAHLLDTNELELLRDLARSLGKLANRVKTRKGALQKTLTREELARWLEPLGRLAMSPAKATGAPTGEQVLEVLTELGRAKGRSVFVPELVRALGSGTNPEAVHHALFELARSADVELRPESGVGNLSAEDRALCAVDERGTVISYARALGGGQ